MMFWPCYVSFDMCCSGSTHISMMSASVKSHELLQFMMKTFAGSLLYLKIIVTLFGYEGHFIDFYFSHHVLLPTMKDHNTIGSLYLCLSFYLMY